MLSRKVVKACRVLSLPHHLNCHPQLLIDAASEGDVFKMILNRTMFGFGYRFRRGRWQRPFPKALERYRNADLEGGN